MKAGLWKLHAVGSRRKRSRTMVTLGLALGALQLSGTSLSQAFGADEPAQAPSIAASEAASAEESAEPGPSASPETAQPLPMAPVKRKASKPRIGRSRYTSDISEARADRRYLKLYVGEDRTVDLDFDPSGEQGGITVGNPKTLTFTLVQLGKKRQIVFKPLSAGESNVTVRDVNGELKLIFIIQVMPSNVSRQMSQYAGDIRTLLRDVEGIEVKVVGERVVIDGEVLVPQDYARIVTLVNDEAYSKNVINMAILSPIALQVLSKKIQDDIQVFAPDVKTRVVNGMIFLEGKVDSIDIANRAKQIANLYLPEVRPNSMIEQAREGVQRIPNRFMVQSFIVVNPPPPKKQDRLVRVTVHFVELAKDYSRLFDFKWQPGFASDPKISIGSDASTGAVTSGGLSLSGTISSLFPKLASAQTAGYARVLKTGTVVVRSGQVGKLTEQMGFPYVTQGGNGTVASGQATVGLALSVTPSILGQSEDIQIDLDIQQSNVVGRYTNGTAPVTSNHAITTKLYVKSNESAAVGGVSSADVGTDFNKDDPSPTAFENGSQALFTLLRSKNYRKKKSQFVIFVTPQIIDSASEGTEDLKKNFRVKAK